MDEEIIEKIREEIIVIKKISCDERHFRLDGHVNIILDYLLKLMKISKDEESKQKYEFIWKDLDYTSERKVKFAKWAYDKARKKNAAQKRESEYCSSLKNAISQIEHELSHFRN